AKPPPGLAPSCDVSWGHLHSRRRDSKSRRICRVFQFCDDWRSIRGVQCSRLCGHDCMKPMRARCLFAIALLVLMLPLRLSAQPSPATRAPVQVVVAGSIPGIDDRDLPGVFAGLMADLNLPGWTFGASSSSPQPDRVTWTIKPLPFVGDT